VVATRRFLDRVDDGRPLRVVAVATAAVRDARNGYRLIEALRQAVGIEVEVLGWEEEARLGAVAALASLPLREALIADLGGGSLELTLVRDGEITPLAGLPLGAVRSTRRFFRHDPPGSGEVQALRRAVADLVVPALPVLPASPRLIGLGGTLRTLARVHLAAGRRRAAPVHGFVLGRAELTALCERLRALPLPRRRRLEGLKPKRADIVVAGAVVLDELMAVGGFRAITVCERGVGHGLLIRETFGLEKRAAPGPATPAGGRPTLTGR
jgi:exopolyphosphatase/guanosine-5'-triphosphate,3'-diphosphate pyrophosphatase